MTDGRAPRRTQAQRTAATRAALGLSAPWRATVCHCRSIARKKETVHASCKLRWPPDRQLPQLRHAAVVQLVRAPCSAADWPQPTERRPNLKSDLESAASSLHLGRHRPCRQATHDQNDGGRSKSDRLPSTHRSDAIAKSSCNSQKRASAYWIGGPFRCRKADSSILTAGRSITIASAALNPDQADHLTAPRRSWTFVRPDEHDSWFDTVADSLTDNWSRSKQSRKWPVTSTIGRQRPFWPTQMRTKSAGRYWYGITIINVGISPPDTGMA